MADEAVARPADPGRVLGPVPGRPLGGGREPDDRCCVQSAGPHVALLATAVQDGDRLVAPGKQQCPGAYRAAALVCGDRECRGTAVSEADRKPSRRLTALPVKRTPLPLPHGPPLPPPLDRRRL